MIALAREELPEPEPVITDLAGLAGTFGPPKLASQTERMATLDWGDATAAYTLVPRPIPPSQLDGPCSTAWYWPEAAIALQDHPAHLLITLVDEGRDAPSKSMRLTWLTVAVANRVPAAGILWGPGGLIHQPQAFAQQAEQMTRDDLPLYLWIDFRIESANETQHRLFTTGLTAFDRKELEVANFVGSPQQLLDDAYNVAHYLLVHPSVVKDADTIGLPDGRHATARHESSMLGDDQEVIRLDFD